MPSKDASTNGANKKATQLGAGSLANDTVTTVLASWSVSSFPLSAEIISCSDLGVAALIEWLGYDLIVESLQLEDEVFNFLFSTKYYWLSERRQLLAHVQSHIAGCAHCQAINRKVIEEGKLIDDEIESMKDWPNQNSTK